MQFRLELDINPFGRQLNIQQPVMLVGSCFTDHMSHRLRQLKFHVLENPHGIVFNPLSIERVLTHCVEQRSYTVADLFHYQDLWSNWDFHGRFSHPDADAALADMQAANMEAYRFLQKADWLILTLGSAFVYELKTNEWGGTPGQVVANCHKVPANHFRHRLASVEELLASLKRTISLVRSVRAGLPIIFTISPVRHYREGLVENNRSKGALHLTVAALLQQVPDLFYFPAYELIIDDLRDYRFYAEDLVHPNYAATQYVWEKFSAACIDAPSLQLMKDLDQLRLAMQHRPQHAGTAAHQQFLQKMLQKTKALKEAHPFLDLQAELAYFQQQLIA
jgi:hypothetical protein